MRMRLFNIFIDVLVKSVKAIEIMFCKIFGHSIDYLGGNKNKPYCTRCLKYLGEDKII